MEMLGWGQNLNIRDEFKIFRKITSPSFTLRNEEKLSLKIVEMKIWFGKWNKCKWMNIYLVSPTILWTICKISLIDGSISGFISFDNFFHQLIRPVGLDWFRWFVTPRATPTWGESLSYSISQLEEIVQNFIHQNQTFF